MTSTTSSMELTANCTEGMSSATIAAGMFVVEALNSAARMCTVKILALTFAAEDH